MNSSSTDLLEGNVTLPGATPLTASVTGSRHVWNATKNPASDYVGYYTVALRPEDATDTTMPQGDGFLTFTLNSAGAVIWSGQLADGTVIAPLSTTLWATGELPLFSLLYTNKGSLSQSLSIDTNGKIVRGTPHWIKKPQAPPVRAYAAGFSTTHLAAAGAEYLKPLAGYALLDIDAPAEVVTTFSTGGIEDVTQFNGLNQPFLVSETHVATFNLSPIANPAQVKLTKLDTTKGLFTGTMTLKDDNPFNSALPQISRVVTFNGVLLPVDTMGTGYFLLPSIAGPPANVTTSPQSSGLVRLTAP